MFHEEQFDLVVVGGGHAGTEACYIASKYGLKVALVTMKDALIGSTPCNPSIGGVGKGQVVREIDALGGVMGKIADRAGIQYRTLNESKGFAVQSTRVQVDKDLYSKYVTEALQELENLKIIYAKVNKIIKNDQFVISTECSLRIKSDSLIITAGTFLNGKLHCGLEQEKGGRIDTESSDSLNSIFSEVKTIKNRFKTGTPARLNINTVDFSKMDEQKSDCSTRNFSIYNENFKREQKQVSCYLTRTNEKTLKIIRDNKEKSPMYNGQIKAVGARYCPSIEDKAYRYPDKNIHHVFVEPEGLERNTVYPSGISSSLPKDIQDSFISTINGLENAEIEQYGYAVEYDVVDTTQLDRTLMVKNCENLYFAGQVNGTSGYEEAAGQGLVAGINASLRKKGEKPLVLRRTDTYIGVMIEDLVTNRRDEPYRLFTARAENRLLIREDNAFLRIYPYIEEILDNYSHKLRLESLISQYLILKKLVSTVFYNNNFYNDEFGLEKFLVEQSKKTSLLELLKLPWINPVDLLIFICEKEEISFEYTVIRTVAIESKYEGYVKRANNQYKKVANLESRKIHLENILDSDNISFECKQRIKDIGPETFGQLKRINGIRTATLAIVAAGAY